MNTLKIRRVSLLICFIISGLVFSCKSKDVLNLNEIIISGKWKMSGLKVDPGVRMKNNPNAPVVTDLYTYMAAEGLGYITYQFNEDGSGEMRQVYPNGQQDISAFSWSLSEDSKKLTMVGNTVDVVSYGESSLEISMSVYIRDQYSRQDILCDWHESLTKQ